MTTLLYFAAVREAIGVESEEIAVPEDVGTPRELANWLSQKGGGYAAAFANLQKLRCAVDQTMAPLDADLKHAEEIAFFPPVTGG